MIVELVEELNTCIEAIEALADNDDYNEALKEFKVNDNMRPGGYSFNTPGYIDDIFWRYVETLDKVIDYRETDENYLQTIADLGELGYLYEK
jgi:hypothetical protein